MSGHRRRVWLLEGADQRAATDRPYQKRGRRSDQQLGPAVAADGSDRRRCRFRLRPRRLGAAAAEAARRASRLPDRPGPPTGPPGAGGPGRTRRCRSPRRGRRPAPARPARGSPASQPDLTAERPSARICCIRTAPAFFPMTWPSISGGQAGTHPKPQDLLVGLGQGGQTLCASRSDPHAKWPLPRLMAGPGQSASGWSASTTRRARRRYWSLETLRAMLNSQALNA